MGYRPDLVSFWCLFCDFLTTFWTKFSEFILDPIPPNVFRYIRLLIIYQSINTENSDTPLEFTVCKHFFCLLCWIYYLETSSLWRPPRAPRALTSGIKVGVAGLSIGRWGRSKAWSCRRSVLETISVFKLPSFCVVFVALRCRDVLQKKALFCVPDLHESWREKKKQAR